MLFQACREIFCAIKSRNIQKIKGKIQMAGSTHDINKKSE